MNSAYEHFLLVKKPDRLRCQQHKTHTPTPQSHCKDLVHIGYRWHIKNAMFTLKYVRLYDDHIVEAQHTPSSHIKNEKLHLILSDRNITS